MFQKYRRRVLIGSYNHVVHVVLNEQKSEI